MADMIRPEDIRRIISDSDRRRPLDESAPEPLTRRTAVDEPHFDESSDHDAESAPLSPEMAEPGLSHARSTAADFRSLPQAGASAWIDPPGSPGPAGRPAAPTLDPDGYGAAGRFEAEVSRAPAEPRGGAAIDHGGYDGPPLGAPEEPIQEEVYEEAPPPRRKRRLLLPLLGLVALLIGAGAVVLFGTRGQEQVAGVEAPTLKAQVEVDKVKPSVPGGLEVPNRDVQVLDQTASRGEPEAVVLQPPPEEPTPLPPVPQVVQPEAEAAPVAAQAENQAEDQIAAIIEESEGQGALEGTAPSADRLAAPGLAIPPRPSAKLDGREDTVAAALSGSTPASETTTETTAPTATAPETTTAPDTTTAATTANQTTAGQGYLVQLASLTSAEAAERSWQTMSSRHSAQLSGLSHSVQKIEIEGRGTFYRLRAGPFADREAASARCQQLKDKGQACIVVAP